MVVLRPTLPEPMIALLDHGDIGDAVLLGEIIGGGEAVPAAADDHHVVVRLRLGLAPDRLPVAVAGDRVDEQASERIAHGRDLCAAARASIDISRRLLDILRHDAKDRPQNSPQTVGFLLVPGFALMSYAAAVEPLARRQPASRARSFIAGGTPPPAASR